MSDEKIRDLLYRKKRSEANLKKLRNVNVERLRTVFIGYIKDDEIAISEAATGVMDIPEGFKEEVADLVERWKLYEQGILNEADKKLEAIEELLK